MIKVGVTGSSGFIGTHLVNYLKLKDNIEIVPFKRSYFDNTKHLSGFVKSCDAIVHLAALNRHNDPDELYHTNISLVKKLIDAMEAEKALPHIIFSSSIQEERDNPYGRSKRAGRELFARWAEKNNARFSGMVIPNVFGPFGAPFYNSVVATFSYQLTHNEQPVIDNDGTLRLIYVGELVEIIHNLIKDKRAADIHTVSHTSEITVSGLLQKLNGFKESYMEQAVFPETNSAFDLNLFNTFRSYIDHKSFFPFNLTKHSDDRGVFVETVKALGCGQVSFSTTKPGVTRGNHFHTRKIERFAVLKGRARIEMRKTGTSEVLSFDLNGEQPAFVDMPIWYTHNLTNTGEDELVMLFWINEFFNPQDPDTFYEDV